MTNAGQKRSLWLAVAGIPVLFAALFVLQTRIDARTRSVAQQQQELLLRSPAAIEKMSLGYNSLLADVYWTRAVQYYGSQLVARDLHFPLLWPLLDISTTLDPKLLPAYHFGAMFLSEPYLGAHRPDLAAKLVERGIAANPERWGLYADLGFLYYWYLRDYRDASQAYLDGANKAHGPSWMKMMAARLDQKGGSLETSRMIWTQVYESNSDPKIRELALSTLKGLKAQQDEQQLDALVSQYRQRFGRYPASFAQMREAGLLSGMPVDPDGYPYVLGPGGKSALSPRTDVKIPREPRTPPKFSAK
jgi:hypothetical protein